MTDISKTLSASITPCQMYKDHGSAVPSIVEGHHRHPVYMQKIIYGEVRDLELLWVCSTCHDNIHAMIYWLTGKRAEPNPMPPPRAVTEAKRTVDWYTTSLLG